MSGVPPAPAGVRPSFPAIDALRALAALLVLVYHVIEIGRWTDFPVSGAALAFRIGWVGVDLFFVISGFVIGLSALQGFERQGAGFRRDFARRRIARIVPLYALTALAFLLLVDPSLLALPAAQFARHVLAHAAFVHNTSPTTHGSIDGPNWSVALEMQFYVAMALAAPWIARRGALPLAAGLVAIAWARRAGVWTWLASSRPGAHVLHVYTSQLPGTLDAFGIGIAMALAVLHPGERLGRLLAASWRNFALWSVAFAALGAWAWTVFWSHSGYWDDRTMVVFWRTPLALAFGSLVAAAIALPAQASPLLRPLRYLGEISYGIYLWHLPVLLTLTQLPGTTGERLMWLTLAGTLSLAAFSWHFFERPFVRRAHRP